MSDFIKPAKTLGEQISILIERGLVVEDYDWAIDVLQRVSYYRLTGYLIEYKNGENKYRLGTSLRLIYETYQFDMRFRNMLLGVLESIEISIRTKVTYYMALALGPMGYRNPEYFSNTQRHKEHLEKIDTEITRSGELFANHFRDKYDGKFPIWVASEMMSFGTLSKLYSNMKRRHRNNVSKQYYGVDEVLLCSWLVCLVNVRNSCAHFARLYDRALRFPPKIVRGEEHMVTDSASIFAALVITRRLCEPRSEWRNFVTNLVGLLDKYERFIDKNKLGFPENWDDILMSHAFNTK